MDTDDAPASEAVDLTGLVPLASRATIPLELPSGVGSYDPARDQEKARARIAYILLWTLVAIAAFAVLTGGVLVAQCEGSDDCRAQKEALGLVTSLLNAVFTPIIGLVGSVIGFYFGAKSATDK